MIYIYGSVWITCVLVWIGGMDRPVGSVVHGMGRAVHFESQPNIYLNKAVKEMKNVHDF